MTSAPFKAVVASLNPSEAAFVVVGSTVVAALAIVKSRATAYVVCLIVIL